MSGEVRNYAEGGTVDNAVQYWKGVAENQDRLVAQGKRNPYVGAACKTGAQIMNGFIAISGLHEVEKSSGKLGWDVGSGASNTQIAKDTGMLLFDSTMAGLTFLPAGKVLQGVKGGKGLYTTAKAGEAITGMVKAGKGAAAPVAGEITAAIEKTIPQGGKVTAEHSKALLSELTDIGKKYGITIQEGGKVGESVGSMNKILVNTKAGGSHEITHVVQQLQTRATALEAQAQKLGKPVKDLTAVERQGAFQNMVKPFEEVAYNQHEMWAKEATKLGGGAKSSYADALKRNVASFEEALSGGNVPSAEVSGLSRAYGEVPNILGRSQGENLSNVGQIQLRSVNYAREQQ
ncbi:MAG: hypothetical protein RDV48_12610 [Candidatus Eremiobacteraeota bacterium]|nr:hypothetical protein [Candidatus Eremiobacteraeota bacterium]